MPGQADGQALGDPGQQAVFAPEAGDQGANDPNDSPDDDIVEPGGDLAGSQACQGSRRMLSTMLEEMAIGWILTPTHDGVANKSLSKKSSLKFLSSRIDAPVWIETV